MTRKEALTFTCHRIEGEDGIGKLWDEGLEGDQFEETLRDAACDCEEVPINIRDELNLATCNIMQINYFSSVRRCTLVCYIS